MPTSGFCGPAEYTIVVEGTVPPSWENRMAGLRIATVSLSEGRMGTCLRGNIRDQAELQGVLDSLYHLHMTIVSVTQNAANGASDSPPPKDQTSA